MTENDNHERKATGPLVVCDPDQLEDWTSGEVLPETLTLA